MFYIFITKPSAVLAYSKAHSMAAGLVICAGVLGVQGLDRESTFYADGHCIQLSIIGDRRLWWVQT